MPLPSEIEVPDAEGECHMYSLRSAVPSPHERWAVVVERHGSDRPYRVAQQWAGRFTCTCESFKYRTRGAPYCKHCEAIEEIMSSESPSTCTSSPVTLYSAWIAAQAEMESPAFDSDNPHFRSRFASLKAVRAAVLPVLHRHGLGIIMAPASGEKGPQLVTRIIHVSGAELELPPLEIPCKPDAQGYGSAITYARRYVLQTIAGVVGEADDDGNAASQPAATERRTRPAPAPTKAPPLTSNGAQPPRPVKLGPAFRDGLHKMDRDLAETGLCKRYELVQHVLAKLSSRFGSDLIDWPEEAVRKAKTIAATFRETCKAQPAFRSAQPDDRGDAWEPEDVEVPV